jgi:hypothetical protein
MRKEGRKEGGRDGRKAGEGQRTKDRVLFFVLACFHCIKIVPVPVLYASACPHTYIQHVQMRGSIIDLNRMDR